MVNRCRNRIYCHSHRACSHLSIKSVHQSNKQQNETMSGKLKYTCSQLKISTERRPHTARACLCPLMLNYCMSQYMHAYVPALTLFFCPNENLYRKKSKAFSVFLAILKAYMQALAQIHGVWQLAMAKKHLVILSLKVLAQQWCPHAEYVKWFRRREINYNTKVLVCINHDKSNLLPANSIEKQCFLHNALTVMDEKSISAAQKHLLPREN